MTATSQNVTHSSLVFLETFLFNIRGFGQMFWADRVKGGVMNMHEVQAGLCSRLGFGTPFFGSCRRAGGGCDPWWLGGIAAGDSLCPLLHGSGIRQRLCLPAHQ